MSQLKTTPKDVFLQLLMMVALYISVTSLITLSFAYVNYQFPDTLNYYPLGVLESIRFSSSMLIVSFPILIFLSWFIQADLRKSPEKHELTFRKWLVYLTLLISAIAIIVDLIQLVNRFYGGELTLPFTLKVVSVLLVAGGVFGYYMWDVQHEPHKSKIPARIAWSSTGLVLAMLIMSFMAAGSPKNQREIRMDEQRIGDLQVLQNQIVSHWQLKKSLPPTLDALKNEISGFIPPNDPETKQSYEYVVLGKLEFKLCTNFNRPGPLFSSGMSRPIAPEPFYPKEYYGGSANIVWDHEAGPQCFERSIDPELYPARLEKN